jgi:hypothetical protein
MTSDESDDFFEGLPHDLRPKDDVENLDEWLDQLFPQGPDNTIEWLCYCLTTTQVAMIMAMLKRNSLECKETSAYNQRIQRLQNVLDSLDDRNVTNKDIEWALKFVEENHLAMY